MVATSPWDPFTTRTCGVINISCADVSPVPTLSFFHDFFNRVITGLASVIFPFRAAVFVFPHAYVHSTAWITYSACSLS